MTTSPIRLPFTSVLIFLLLATVASTMTSASQPKGLGLTDIALIREALHLQATLGPTVWPEWKNPRPPFLFKTRESDYLLNHPNPPAEFVPYFDRNWGDTVWTRVNKDSLNYQAAFPINGIVTVVITAPAEDYSPCLWVLKAAHEMFHLSQGLGRVVNPFVGPYSRTDDLSFPFEYSNPNVMAACRIEGELLFKLVTSKEISPTDSALTGGVFRDMQKVFAAVLGDSLQLFYKQLAEWKEGVARYTERELARQARDPSVYQPTEDFHTLFHCDYSAVWNDNYEGMTNPIRFVGEGVRGRGMFYYSGMAKAYLLDRIYPGWRSGYFTRTLDALIIE